LQDFTPPFEAADLVDAPWIKMILMST